LSKSGSSNCFWKAARASNWSWYSSTVTEEVQQKWWSWVGRGVRGQQPS
jgi:hypothetical protein